MDCCWYESIDYHLAVFAHAWQEIDGVFGQVREVLSDQVNRLVIDFFGEGKGKSEVVLLESSQVVSRLVLFVHA